MLDYNKIAGLSQIKWSKPCKALIPECGYYGPSTTNINKAPVKPVQAFDTKEALQRKYDCAAETGYPACLIAASPGAPTCRVAVHQEMSKKFHDCLSAKLEPVVNNTTTKTTKTAGMGGGNLAMIAIVGGFITMPTLKECLKN